MGFFYQRLSSESSRGERAESDVRLFQVVERRSNTYVEGEAGKKEMKTPKRVAERNP